MPLLRLLMMFGGGDRAAFARKDALDVLQNGLEKEGLLAPAKGKHMHRVMVLYQEFLDQFCDHPEPPPPDADRQQARIQELRDLMRERQELEHVLEESRVSAARRRELAGSEVEDVLRVVREELREGEALLRDAREEARRVRHGLQESEEEVREVGNQRRWLERELEGVKKELREARAKTREELEIAQKELNEVMGKARSELEGAEEESKDAMEKTLKEFRVTVRSLKAKMTLAWFCFRLSLIGVLFTLLWVYF